jgi:acylphosphatase
MSRRDSGAGPGADFTGGEGPDAGLAGRAGPGGAISGGAISGGAVTSGDVAGSDAPGDRDAPARLTAWLAGQVQGVGLRWWIRARALELGLVGSAENLEDGRVKVIAEGAATACRELLAVLAGPGTPGRVTRVTQRWDNPRGGITGFTER